MAISEPTLVQYLNYGAETNLEPFLDGILDEEKELYSLLNLVFLGIDIESIDVKLDAILKCCQDLGIQVADGHALLQTNIDNGFEDINKLLRRIFSDQRNQSQLIDALTRRSIEIQDKLGISTSLGRLKPKGDSYYGSTHQ